MSLEVEGSTEKICGDHHLIAARCISPDAGFFEKVKSSEERSPEISSSQTESSNKILDKIDLSDSVISSSLFILPFSPLKDRTVTEVAVPMFPRDPDAVQFCPPIRLHIECNDDESDPLTLLLAKLPDYDDFQQEIVQSIYVVEHVRRKSKEQNNEEEGEADDDDDKK